MNEFADDLALAQGQVRGLETALVAAITSRDALIVQAVAVGVTPYRIAKWTGLSAQAVHNALARTQNTPHR